MEIIYSFKDIGTKKIQEDLFFYGITSKYEFYFVGDGHGGKKENKIVNMFQEGFFKKRFERYFFVEKNILNQKNIKFFFISLDKFFLKRKFNEGMCLTGIILDLSENIIYVINIGDTKTYVFDNKNNLIYQTPIHNLENKEELDRIVKMNRIDCVKNKRYKKLSITRSLGDYDCKDIFNEPLVSFPDIYKLNNNRPYIFVLCTDGLNNKYYKLNKMLEAASSDLDLLVKTSYKINLQKEALVDNICVTFLKNKLVKCKAFSRNSVNDIIFKLLQFITLDNQFNHNYSLHCTLNEDH